MASPTTSEPVSYTHLDVYKRQDEALHLEDLELTVQGYEAVVKQFLS